MSAELESSRLVRHTNRPVGREGDLFDRAAGYAFFRHRRSAGAH